MSFRVEFSMTTGNAPPAGKERPSGHGTPAELAADLLCYREAAGLEAFQINHGQPRPRPAAPIDGVLHREVKPRLA
jgi:hypothetical protein